MTDRIFYEYSKNRHFTGGINMFIRTLMVFTIMLAFGDSKKFHSYECTNTATRQYIESLAFYLLDVANLRQPVRIEVIDTSQINASARHDRIRIFWGAIETAQTSEEVAAVLAHEVCHIAAGDSYLLEKLMWRAITDVVMAQKLPELRQRRHEMEYSADSCAHHLLMKASIDPKGLRHFIEKALGESAGDLPDTSTHPLPSARVSRLESLPVELHFVGLPSKPHLSCH